MRCIILLFAAAFMPCMALAQETQSDKAVQPQLYTPAQIREKFGVEVVDGNYASVVKAALEWMNRAAGDETYSADIVVESLKETALRLPEPARGLINYIVADFYRSYWQTNRWQILGRTSAPDAGGTLDTWDLQRLFAEAVKHYGLALSDADALKAAPVAGYNAILSYYAEKMDMDTARKYSARYFPTLYDFILSGTIQAFAGELSNARPGRQFVMDDPRYFAPAGEFVKTGIDAPEIPSAEYEAARKKRAGLLFDFNQMAAGQRTAFEKLKKAQRGDGGFAWFEGLAPNRYITQHVVAGFCKLAALKAIPDDYAAEVQTILDKGFEYLDADLLRDYETAKNSRDFNPVNKHISYIHLHYLHAASFTGHKPENAAQREAFDFWYAEARKYWNKFNIYGQGLAALAFHRYGDTELARQVAASLKAASHTTTDMGMFWRENRAGYFWHEAPIETQALMIAVFDEVADDAVSVNELKIWLLRNKQTNDWQTTKATADACYALLRTGSDLLDESRALEVTIGGRSLAEATGGEIRPEAGTGYVKTVWADSEVTPAMGLLEVTNPNRAGVAWGGLYWQYFEQADKVTTTETDLRMEKQIFIKRNTLNGPELTAIKEGTPVKVGDLLTVRVILRTHRDYEYVHLKDMRAAGLEPVRTASGYRYQDGLVYYENMKDASANFFIASLRGGTCVFEYDLRVSHAGDFSNGITTFQCMYAPEFSAHSEGVRIKAE